MTDLTHSSAAMLRPPGPTVPLPIVDPITKLVVLLYDTEAGIPPTQDIIDQLNTAIAAIADSGLMFWASAIVYFRTECGFGDYLQDVSSYRVSDRAYDLSGLGIQVAAPWRRPIYLGDEIYDYDNRPGYAWRFFNHFGIDIYDASGGIGVYGLFDGFFPGKVNNVSGDFVDLSSTDVSNTSFKVTWTPGAASGHLIHPKIGLYVMSDSFINATAFVDVSAGSHTFTELTAGTTYDVSGYLMDRYDQSTRASSVSVTTTGGAAVPSAPSDLQIDTKTATTATLSWSYISVAAYFNIYVGGIFDSSANNVQGGRPFYNFTGLSPSTGYSVEVTAVNVDDVESARSEALVFQTLPGIPLPAAPTGVTATNPYSRGFTVSWNHVATATSYTVYVDSSTAGIISFPDIPGTTFDVSGNFEPGAFNSTRLFTVRVSATNATGEGDKSPADPAVSVSTTYAPPAPTPLQPNAPLTPLRYFASEEDTPIQTTNELVIIDAATYDSSRLDANYALVDIAGLTSINTIRSAVINRNVHTSREMIAICIIPPSASFYAPGGNNGLRNVFAFNNTALDDGENQDTKPFNSFQTTSKRTIAYTRFTLNMFINGFYRSTICDTYSAPSAETLASLALTYSYTP